MFCNSCGKEIPDDSTFCPLCGAAVKPAKQPEQPSQVQKHVPNYLVQAILVTLFCCLPTGIVAIIFAAQVNGKLQTGDYEGAVQASNKAKTWSWVSFGLGIAGGFIYLLLILIGAAGDF